MLKQSIAMSLVCLTASGAAADQTITDLATAADNLMDQVRLSRTLAAGASYYAGVGGIAPDGSITAAQLSVQMVSAYNDALTNVQNTTYYNTSMLLADQADAAFDNMSVAIDALVDATTTFATVSAVADMAADADTVQEQMDLQNAVSVSDMSVTDADVDDYNTALADVETYAQEAAGFLAASNNTHITSSTDKWAEGNNISVAAYGSVTYDATSDLLILQFYGQNNETYGGVGFEGYLTGEFKTADDIYNAGIAYGG
jgi:hypothetical protein